MTSDFCRLQHLVVVAFEFRSVTFLLIFFDKFLSILNKLFAIHIQGNLLGAWQVENRFFRDILSPKLFFLIVHRHIFHIRCILSNQQCQLKAINHNLCVYFLYIWPAIMSGRLRCFTCVHIHSIYSCANSTLISMSVIEQSLIKLHIQIHVDVCACCA